MNENETANPGLTPAPTGILNFDGVEYPMDGLSEVARNQLGNVRAADAELAHLRLQTAITQTARMAYLQALKAELTKA